MSDHPNVGVARKAYEAFAAGDLETVSGRFTDDIVWHMRGAGGLDGDYVGHDGVFSLFAKLFAETDNTYRLEVHTILADDEHSVALLTQHAERAGRQLNGPVVHITHLREGKICEFWAAFPDPVPVHDFWA